MQDKSINEEGIITRRDFIKTAAIGVGATAIVGVAAKEGLSQSQPTMKVDAPKTQSSSALTEIG